MFDGQVNSSYIEIGMWHQCGMVPNLPSSLCYFNWRVFNDCSWKDAQALPTQWIQHNTVTICRIFYKDLVLAILVTKTVYLTHRGSGFPNSPTRVGQLPLFHSSEAEHKACSEAMLNPMVGN